MVMSTPPGLPDFQHPATTPPARPAEAAPNPRRPVWPWLVGGGGCLLAVILAIVLVIVLVVRPAPASDGEGQGSPAAQEEPAAQPSGEYVPDGEEEGPTGQGAPEDLPTVSCHLPDPGRASDAPAGYLVGGGLRTAVVDGWSSRSAWRGAVAYTTDVAMVSQDAGPGWYSYAALGRGDFSEAEGGYPGAEDAATWILQCAYSRGDLEPLYGAEPVTENWVSEPVTVDGMSGHRATVDVHVAEGSGVTFTPAWRISVTVLETPDGPTVLLANAATGLPEQLEAQEQFIAGLEADA